MSHKFSCCVTLKGFPFKFLRPIAPQTVNNFLLHPYFLSYPTFSLISSFSLSYSPFFYLVPILYFYPRLFYFSSLICPFFLSLILPFTSHYASPSSGEAYRDPRLTTNFELWVEIFCVPTCFHKRIPKPCLSVCPSVCPSVRTPRKETTIASSISVLHW